jgi:hypothetical protein
LFLGTSSGLDALLARLSDVQRRGHASVARCPAHQDHRPSLSIATGQDGRILLNCRAGCRTEDVLRAIGVSWSALFSHSNPDSRYRKRPATTTCELDEVRHDLVARERRLAERRDHWSAVFEMAAEACETDRIVTRARQLIRDDENGWALEDQVTGLERDTWVAEAEIHEAVVGRALW